MDTPLIPRSPLLLDRTKSGLLIVDVQEKLIPLLPGKNRIVWNLGRLLAGARILEVSVAATEQYPRGLGSTIETLAAPLAEVGAPVPEKLRFSCAECSEIFVDWRDRGIDQILVAGIETHVCIMQTVLDLMSDGFDLFVAVDATGSRYAVDRDTALHRMEASGATLTTTEAALFEWCGIAGTEAFKSISQLIREPPPED